MELFNIMQSEKCIRRYLTGGSCAGSQSEHGDENSRKLHDFDWMICRVGVLCLNESVGGWRVFGATTTLIYALGLLLRVRTSQILRRGQHLVDCSIYTVPG